MPSPEPKTIELAGRDGLALAADVAGDPAAPPVVLFHGGGQTRHAWGTTLEVLGQRWYAFSVDLRGHGDSAWAPDGDYGLDAFADDVREVARSFDRPPVLVGASLGGISSLTAVAENQGEPLARAIVLVDIAPRIERDGVDRIGEFMTSHLDGFESLEEDAEVLATRVAAAEVLQDAGRWAEAAEALDRALDGLAESGLGATVHRVVGRRLAAEGRADEAHAELHRGLAVADRSGDRYEQGLLLLALAASDGDAGASDRRTRQGREILDAMGVLRSR